MLFTSGTFSIFLAVTFGVYYVVPASWQLRWLVLASLFFYSFENPPLLLLLLAVALCDVVFSRLIVNDPHPRKWAVVGITVNLLVLVFFKYNRLLAETFPTIGSGYESTVRTLLLLPLPIGISFYTFHGISLLADSFRPGPARNDLSSARGFGEHIANTLLYVSFFPQLIAGPITKAHQFYPQIGVKRFSDIDWEAALRALIVGYFLKVVVADNLSQQTFWLTYPYFIAFSTLNLLVFLIGYSAQIFSDFAGYSLVAIGLGKLFGYSLPTNFLFPYISQTFSEFWTRWHISLSSWLREYLYFPLGGNRKGPLRTYFNLLIVMTLGGLWHGAAWSYAVWGFWHGSALVVERLCSGLSFYKHQTRAMRIIRAILVFVVVTAGWLLFRLPNFSDVIAFLKALGTNMNIAPSPATILFIAIYGAPVAFYHMHYVLRCHASACGKPYILDGIGRPIILGLLVAGIVLQPGPPQSFIYFQF